jgi:integrase
VWESLHTSDENEAKRLEKAKDVEFERRLRDARERGDPLAMAQHVVRAAALDRDGQEDLEEIVADTEDGIKKAPAEIQETIRGAARQLLRENWYRSAAVRILLAEIGEILEPFSREELAQLEPALVDFARQTAEQARSTSIAAHSSKFCAWGAIFDSWAAEMKPGPKTVYSWKRIIRKLVSHLADKPELTVDEALVWNAASLTEEQVIEWKNCLTSKNGPTTIKNHLTILRTLYNHAAANKLLPASVAEDVKRVKHKAKRRVGTGRVGYTDDEARMILTAARQEGDPVLRWSPWLAAALGTRIDEICGAMVADIEVDDDGIAWFAVTLDNREDDPEQAPELKSENAERKLPIPSALWHDEKFSIYVQELPQNGPLFPRLTPDMFGRRGGNGSKRVQRWVRDRVGIKDKRKAPSHSWRHRFRSIVRNPRYGIGEDVADYMCGHSGNGGEGRGYGEYRDAMVEAIRRLPPPLPSHGPSDRRKAL